MIRSRHGLGESRRDIGLAEGGREAARAVDPAAVWLVSSVARGLMFARRVGGGFLANKGLLLAGSVAYNTLLSMIPLFAISLAILSYFFAEDRILEAIRLQLDFLAPGQAEALSTEIAGFLEHRQLVWGLGFFVLLFFSSLAFRMLEDAIAVIFRRGALTPELEGSRLRQSLKRVLKRDFWVSAVIPYLYIGVVTLTLLGLTILLSLLGRVGAESKGWLAARALWLLGFTGQVIMFASIYKVMPAAHIGLRRALTGGLAAAALWEIARRFLTWYFVNLSLVGRVYGSLTTVVIVLLGLEVAAIIVLLGAQVIAELERSAAAGVPWWQSPREEPAAADSA